MTATDATGPARPRHPQAVCDRSLGRLHPHAGPGENVASAVASAAAGTVICLSSGSYGALKLEGNHAGDVTLESSAGAHASVGAVAISGSHLVVRGLWVDGEVALAAGTSSVTLDHNDITGGGQGVVFVTSDCTVANAPTWAGCEPLAPVSNVVISGNHFHGIGQPGSEDAIHLDNWRDVTVSAMSSITSSSRETTGLSAVGLWRDESDVYAQLRARQNCQEFF